MHAATARSRARWLAVAAAALVLGACAKRPRFAAAPGLETIDDYEAELERTGRELADLGLAPPPPVATAAPTTPPAPEPDVDRALEEDAIYPEAVEEGEAAGADEDEASALSSRWSEREIMAEEAESAPADEARQSRRARWRERRDRREQRAADDERCERICDLAEVTCELADRICDLAERHPGEERYQSACVRAQEQCDLASAACERCE